MNRLHLGIVACLLSFGSVSSWAAPQAYCALRDPDTRIYEMVPEATSYRSIVRTVSNKSRERMARVLPFTLHFNELGKHTVYAAYEDERPAGLVHVRSEPGRWGLVEIAWSLTPDLRVRDFEFQRCRDRKKRFLDDPFRAQLRGKSRVQLEAYLNEEGTGLKAGGLAVAGGADELAFLAVKSAIKTLMVTELEWGKDVRELQAQARAHDAFGSTTRITELVPAYTDETRRELEACGLGESDQVDRERTQVWVARDREGEVRGHLLRSEWLGTGPRLDLWWVVDSGGVVLDVHALDWTEEVQEAFERLEGQAIPLCSTCGTTVEAVAQEIGVVWAEWRDG